jgi:hypothetical protein
MDKDLKILDDLLEFINDGGMGYGGSGDNAMGKFGALWKLNKKYDIDSDKFWFFIKVLVYDGYIEDNIDLKKYEVTPKGYYFLKKKGYKGKVRRKIKRLWLNNAKILILPIAAIIISIISLCYSIHKPIIPAQLPKSPTQELTIPMK